MKIYHRLKDHPQTTKPVVITMGNFDGVHQGHQKLIANVQSLSKQKHAESIVITFEQHPKTYFHPEIPFHYLCSLDEKISILDNLGIDKVFVLKFDTEFAEQTAEIFLTKLCKIFPQMHMIFGSNARIGKNREADCKKIKELANSLSFTVDFEEILILNGAPVTSSRIRQLIENEQVQEAEELLGRKIQ